MTDSDEGTEKPDGIVAAASTALSTAIGKEGVISEWYRDRFKASEQLRGDYAREALEEKLEKRKQKRRKKNLEGHNAHLNKHRNAIYSGVTTPEDSNAADQLAFDWTGGIQDVDPSDAELSAIWYAALELIVEKGSAASLVFEKIKTLSPLEASVLISGAPHIPRSFGIINRLNRGSLRILERSGSSELLSLNLDEKGIATKFRLSSIAFIIFTIIVFLNFSVFFILDIRPTEKLTFTTLYIFCINLLSAFVIASRILEKYIFLQLSTTGVEIAAIGRKEISKINSAPTSP